MGTFIQVAACVALFLANYAVLGDDIDAIVGGDKPRRDEGTFSVDIFSDLGNGHPCGGSLVDRKYVLTLASCVDIPGAEILVVIGVHDYDEELMRYNFIKADDIIIHPGFNRSDYNTFFFHNVALIKLKKIAKVGKKEINPVALATDDAYETIRKKDRRCYIYGKGYTRLEDGTVEFSTTMRKMATRYIRCKNDYSIFLGTAMDCIKTKNEGDSACNGDGGQGMVCRHQGVWYHVGMYAAYSRLDGCRSPYAGVSSSITYRQWVYDNIQ